MHRSTRAVPNLDKCPGFASITCPLYEVRVDDGVPCQIRNRS